MDILDKKRITASGVRIALLYLAAFAALLVSSYFVLSRNFENLMADYSLKLASGMVEQGVKTIEYEVQGSLREVVMLSNVFSAPEEEQQAAFPDSFFQSGVIRFVYVSETGSEASDGRQRDIRDRQDVANALKGKAAYYGPYFNEENEYVMCYSAPVYSGCKIIGTLSMEKDGYYFSSLIESIRFVDSGESYIINEEGTDIAVSNMEHISWVNDQYNAARLLEEKEDPVTRSVLELERKGLAGETGTGTYMWTGSLCYLVYSPIPSTGWVLLTGIRQEEIVAIVQSAISRSITNGPTLSACIAAFFLLTAAIIVWIIVNLKRSADLNKRLAKTANYDPLTGLQNRNGYHTVLDKLSAAEHDSLACVYVDVNGLHEINNHLGHQAGDTMLKSVADMMQHIFPGEYTCRIGGDEFVTFSRNCSKQDTFENSRILRNNLKAQGYAISLGIEWRDQDINVQAMVNLAEEAMQQDKKQYYQRHGKERQMRTLDQALEQILVKKQDADTFLSVLAPDYKGVYFVNLDSDSIRHLYIPDYFEEILSETNYRFSQAIALYSQRLVLPEYQEQFVKCCDYDYLRTWLNGHSSLEFNYQKNDGEWLKVQILKFKTYTEQNRETLWIFSVPPHSPETAAAAE